MNTATLEMNTREQKKEKISKNQRNHFSPKKGDLEAYMRRNRVSNDTIVFSRRENEKQEEKANQFFKPRNLITGIHPKVQKNKGKFEKAIPLQYSSLKRRRGPENQEQTQTKENLICVPKRQKRRSSLVTTPSFYQNPEKDAHISKKRYSNYQNRMAASKIADIDDDGGDDVDKSVLLFV